MSGLFLWGEGRLAQKASKSLLLSSRSVFTGTTVAEASLPTATCGIRNDGQQHGLWLAAWIRHRCRFGGTKDYECQHGLQRQHWSWESFKGTSQKMNRSSSQISCCLELGRSWDWAAGVWNGSRSGGTPRRAAAPCRGLGLWAEQQYCPSRWEPGEVEPIVARASRGPGEPSLLSNDMLLCPPPPCSRAHRCPV